MVDDTLVVGAAPASLGDYVPPDTKYEGNTNQDEGSDYNIDNPDDPVWSSTRSHDRELLNELNTTVWGILTEPLRGVLKSDL